MECGIKPYYIEKLNIYYANNAKKLYGSVNKILLHFGGISNKDYDYFYVIASDVFTDICMEDKYDFMKGDFDKFLYSCIYNKIKTEITKRNREKRKSDRMSVSMDAPIDDEGNLTLADIIESDYSIEEYVIEDDDHKWSKEVSAFLSSLSPLQREIAIRLSENYTPNEICADLHITMNHYDNSIGRIFSDEKIRPLRPLV